MFYSHTILARKGALGTVWIAAHFEKKLKKPQIEKINIASYADLLMFPEAPIALRLAGHLLYGLVRIYELKVHYAFNDCQRLEKDMNKAISSLKLNLPIDADKFAPESITLPSNYILAEYDLGNFDYNHEENDRHQRTFDETIIPDDDFISIHIDESEMSNSSNFSNQIFGSINEERIPPSEELNLDQNPSNQIEIEIENLNFNQNPSTQYQFEHSNFEPEINHEETTQIDNQIPSSNLNPNSPQINPEPELNHEKTTQVENQISNSNLNPHSPQNNLEPELNHEKIPIENEISNSNVNPNSPPKNQEKTPQIENQIPNPNLNLNTNSADYSYESEIARDANYSSAGIFSHATTISPNNNNNKRSRLSSPLLQIEPMQLKISGDQININNNINSNNIGASSSNPFGESEFQIIPTPPIINKKRKKAVIFDKILCSSNKDMKKGLSDASDLTNKRRKLPDNNLDTLRLQIKHLKDQIFYQPLFTGICSKLAETMNRTIPPVGPTMMMWQPEDATPGSIEVPRLDISNHQFETSETNFENTRSPVQNVNMSPNINIGDFGGADLEMLPRMTWRPENVTPGDDVHFESGLIDENLFNLPTPPVININNDNNNINSDNINIDNNINNNNINIDNENNINGDNINKDNNINNNNNININIYNNIDSDNFNNYGNDNSFNNDNIITNDYDNNHDNINNNIELNFLETPPNIKRKRASVEEEADKSGENLSFVDIERSEKNCWSARSLGMAQFLRNLTPNSETNSEEINLNEIMKNRSKKESARMFFETLVLTTCDYISVKQEEPYGDILIKPRPKLSQEIND